VERQQNSWERIGVGSLVVGSPSESAATRCERPDVSEILSCGLGDRQCRWGTCESLEDILGTGVDWETACQC